MTDHSQPLDDEADAPVGAHLVPEISDRGFSHLPPVVDDWNGSVRAYEASTAFEPHIWLNIGGGALEENDGTAHLTLDQARQIADQLNWLADHHYQNDRP